MPEKFQSLELIENIKTNHFKKTYWPNTFNKVVNFRDTLGKKLYSILQNERNSSLLYLSYHYIMSELILIFELSIVMNELKKKKKKLYSVKKSRIIRHLYNNKEPKFPERFFDLNLKKEKLFFFKTFCNGLFYGLSQKIFEKKIYPLKSLVINRFNLNNFTVTSTKCNEIDRYVIKKIMMFFLFTFFTIGTQKTKKKFSIFFS